jgi:hypothetical protein
MEPEIRQFIPKAARLSSRAAFVRHRRDALTHTESSRVTEQRDYRR